MKGQSNKTLLVVLILTVMIIASGVVNMVQHAQATQLTRTNQQLQADKKTAEAIARNFLNTTFLLNDLARVTQHANQIQREESEGRVVVIRKLVKGNSCALEPVPRHAVDQLRAHRHPLH